MSRVKAGRPSTSEQRDTQSDLLNAAFELFSERGFSKVNLNEIADRANVSIGLIRHYFGSKGGLVEECTGHVMERLSDVIGRILDGTGPSDGAGFIDHLRRKTYDNLIGNVGLLMYLRHLVIEYPAAANVAFIDYFQLLQQEFNRLEAAGHLRPDVNKVWLTFHLMFLQMGPVFLSKQIEAIVGMPSHDPDTVRERNRANATILMHGILSKPPGSTK
jgi:AcrR family transcriptional regulator